MRIPPQLVLPLTILAWVVLLVTIVGICIAAVFIWKIFSELFEAKPDPTTEKPRTPDWRFKSKTRIVPAKDAKINNAADAERIIQESMRRAEKGGTP